jgi:hypothetical protein
MAAREAVESRQARVLAGTVAELGGVGESLVFWVCVWGIDVSR